MSDLEDERLFMCMCENCSLTSLHGKNNNNLIRKSLKIQIGGSFVGTYAANAGKKLWFSI